MFDMMGSGGVGPGWLLLLVLVLIVSVGAATWMVLSGSGTGGPRRLRQAAQRDAEKLLEARLARGEIDELEFESRMAVLTAARPRQH